MNNWTIGRRIITGFAIMLIITATLGGFSLWQVSTLKKKITDLGSNILPSVLVLNEINELVHSNFINVLEIHTASPEEMVGFEKKIEARKTRIDGLFAKYESSLIADADDRRLLEEAKRRYEILRDARSHWFELLHGNKVEEAQTYFTGTVVPSIEQALTAIQANVDYNDQLGQAAGKSGEEVAQRSSILIGVFMGGGLVISLLLAWLVIRSTNRTLRIVAANLDRGSLQTASAARQVSMASNQLSSGASEQASSVEETSTSLEEMSSMIRATADNAMKATTLASEARALSDAGSGMRSEVAAAMSIMEVSSSEVAKIVKNIDEIAFQTNILALNAAVEAARAGEAGAGFAVVADEVRSLAQRSAAAAKETAEKIDAAIVSSRNGAQASAKVGDALSQIAEKVKATDLLVADIARAASEQSQGIDQINGAMAQMDKVTQSNASSAEESASAAEELDAQAETMKELVAQLRQLVGETEASREGVSSGRSHLNSLPPEKGSPLLGGTGSRGVSRGKGIPMPGDTIPAQGSHGAEDSSFRNF
ncbi:MAG: methyl-accepting chemotaxis protein [bacterium]